MRILVTGGTGFLGRHVIARLADAGHTVSFIGRNQSLGETIAAATDTRFHALDLSSTEAEPHLHELLSGVEAVIHSAALSSVWGRYDAFYAANVVATEKLLQACLAARVRRFVQISTPSVYFDFRDRLNIVETDPLPARPVNHYAATKRLAEEIVLARANEIEVVMLRPRAIFGPWDNTILPRLVRASANGTLPLVRGGNALVDVTCVENAVEAVGLALQASVPSGSCYNITNDEPMTARALLTQVIETLELSAHLRSVPYPLAHALAAGAETWARLTGGNEPRFTRYSIGLLAFSQTLNITAARRELGYQPQLSVAEGLRRYAAWSRAQARG